MPSGNPYIHNNNQDEVKFGTSLPMNGQYAELFRLRGNGTLPDGLYRWSDESNVWIQV